MPVLPPGDLQRVEFMEGHLALWTTNAVAIGLTAAQVTAMSTATTAARAGFNGSTTAHAAAKAATANFHNLTRSLSDLASDAIKAIKLKAAQNNDPNVYVLANIPAPLPPSPPPPPEPPTDLIADPNADGTVTLKWKGSIANSTFFSVWRKVGSSPTWTNIGSTAIKTFQDSTVPSTPIPASITYSVRSQRNNEVSAPSVQAEVVYGGPGVGFTGGAEALTFSAGGSNQGSAGNGTQLRAA
jgi:hypothetical protein